MTCISTPARKNAIDGSFEKINVFITTTDVERSTYTDVCGVNSLIQPLLHPICVYIYYNRMKSTKFK